MLNALNTVSWQLRGNSVATLPHLFLPSYYRLAMSLVMPGKEAAVLQSLAFALHPASRHTQMILAARNDSSSLFSLASRILCEFTRLHTKIPKTALWTFAAARLRYRSSFQFLQHPLKAAKAQLCTAHECLCHKIL